VIEAGAALEEPKERRYELGVPLASSGLAKDGRRFFLRSPRAVGAIARDRVVSIGDSDDPSQQWDGVAGESVGIPAAVEVLVMVPDDREQGRRRLERADDLFADQRMLLHQLQLVGAERAGLE